MREGWSAWQGCGLGEVWGEAAGGLQQPHMARGAPRHALESIPFPVHCLKSSDSSLLSFFFFIFFFLFLPKISSERWQPNGSASLSAPEEKSASSQHAPSAPTLGTGTSGQPRPAGAWSLLFSPVWVEEGLGEWERPGGRRRKAEANSGVLGELAGCSFCQRRLLCLWGTFLPGFLLHFPTSAKKGGDGSGYAEIAAGEAGVQVTGLVGYAESVRKASLK